MIPLSQTAFSRRRRRNPKSSRKTLNLPRSIIDNAQSLELATRLAGQVARAATIFRIDEIVVVDNKSISEDTSIETVLNHSDDNESGAAFLLRVSQKGSFS